MVDLFHRLANRASQTERRVFGRSVEYAHKSQDENASFSTIRAIFDPTHTYLEAGNGQMAVSSTETNLDVALSELDFEPDTDDQVKVEVNGETKMFTVADKERLDGDNWRLVLQEGFRSRY